MSLSKVMGVKDNGEDDCGVLMNRNVFLSLPTEYQLPEEVWDLIFDKLTPADFHSVTLALPLWNQIVSSKKQRVLFPLILQLAMDYLPFKTLRECRLVSKKVKAAVDEILTYDHLDPVPQSSSKLVKETRHQRTRDKVRFLEKYTFNEPDDICSFLSHFRSYQGNPLLTRFLDYRESIDPIPYFERSQCLLSRFGHHVWRLDLDPDTHSTTESLTFLTTLLNLVPNIKTLYLSGGIAWRESDLGDIPTLPTLWNLSYLTIEYLLNFNANQNEENSLLWFLLRQCGPALKKLECPGIFLGCRELTGALLTELVPNVQEFGLRYYDFDEDTDKIRFFPKFACGVGWPLKIIRINSAIPIPVGQFIAAINQFAITLTDLKVNVLLEGIDILEVENFFDEQMAVFPMLRKFKTKLINVNWSWILEVLKEKFPNLEELKLITGQDVFRADVERFQKGFEVMPKLKWVKFRHDRFYDANNGRMYVKVMRDGRIL